MFIPFEMIKSHPLFDSKLESDYKHLRDTQSDEQSDEELSDELSYYEEKYNLMLYNIRMKIISENQK